MIRNYPRIVFVPWNLWLLWLLYAYSGFPVGCSALESRIAPSAVDRWALGIGRYEATFVLYTMRIINLLGPSHEVCKQELGWAAGKRRPIQPPGDSNTNSPLRISFFSLSFSLHLFICAVGTMTPKRFPVRFETCLVRSSSTYFLGLLCSSTQHTASPHRYDSGK